MDDEQAQERLNLIEDAINDCKADNVHLSPLATLVAIGIIACPGEINDEQKERAVKELKSWTNVLSKV